MKPKTTPLSNNLVTTFPHIESLKLSNMASFFHLGYHQSTKDNFGK